MMYFGTQYYRPPFPEKRDWEEDIRHIKELNFNVVKLWAVWNWIERREGEFQFDDLDEIVKLCKKYDLKVIINTIPEGAPSYTRTEHPDARYRKADGTVLDYSGPANIPSAGWPGLCMDSPDARKLVCRFIHETAKHFADEKQVIAIDVWNEPHLEPMFDYSGELLCYCDYSAAQFREWLKERYGTIEELNRIWFRSYLDWSEILPPIRFGTGADMIDWRRFWLYNLQRWMRERVQAARSGAPDKIIQSHVAFSAYMGANNEGGLGNELGDEFLLARETDVFGLSSFPLWLMGEEHAAGHLINTEIVAESVRGKIFYQTELQGGAGKAGLLGGLVPQPRDIRMWNWNVLAAGGKGSVYWQYAPEPAGMESPGFGLVDGIEKNTPRALAASAFAKEYNQEALDRSRRVLPVNGILLSRDSDLLTYAAREEQQYAHSFKGVYQALYERGIPVRFVHEDYIEELEKEHLHTLYLPMALSLSDNVRENLVKFAENGGTLILEGPAGMYRENGETDMQFDFLRKLTGASRAGIDALKNPRYVDIKGCDGNVRMEYYRVCADPKGEILGSYGDGIPAVSVRSFGRGKVVWINSFAGQTYWNSREKQTGDFIASLFHTEGYEVMEKLNAPGLVVRLLETEESYLVVVVNHNKEPRTFTAVLNGQSIEQTVGAQDGTLIEISK